MHVHWGTGTLVGWGVVTKIWQGIFSLGVNPFYWYLVTYLWEQKIFNLYFFLFVRMLQYGGGEGLSGGGDINACSNFINLAKWGFLC